MSAHAPIVDGMPPTTFRNTVGAVEIGRLLGVSRPRVHQLARDPNFPSPSGERGGRKVWSTSLVLRYAANTGRLAGRAPILYRKVPTGGTSSRYEGASIVRNVAVLRWQTPFGALAIVVPLTWGAVNNVLDALQIAATADTVVYVEYTEGIDGPDRQALDKARPDYVYVPEWSDIAHVIGTAVPWWPPALRDPSDIQRWQPGRATTQLPAIPDVDCEALRRTARSAAAGSPVRRVCEHLADTVVGRSTKDAAQDVKDTLGADWYDPGVLYLAAAPQLAPFEAEDVPEVVLSDGWSQLAERTDADAAACLAAAVAWNGGRHLPFGEQIHVDPAKSPAGAVWARRLVPTDPIAAHTLLGIDHIVETFRDPRTGIPAGRTRDGDYRTFAPRRLPADSPLDAVLLSERAGSVWIRTQDQHLYPAPHISGVGLSWGYSGGGPAALAHLVDKLLDDISHPAVTHYGAPPAGLRAGAEGDWTNFRDPSTGEITLTRPQLLLDRMRAIEP